MSNATNRPDSLIDMLKGFVLNNWPSKLLSLVLALILWTFLITQDETLTREKIFTDVSISVAGTETIKRNGFIVVSDLSEVLNNATLRVDVPQGAYKDVQPTSYNVRIDLTRINKAGEQDVRVQATNSAAYGTVLEITPVSVPIVVEEYVTRTRIPAVMQTSGDVPASFALASSALSPTVVSVSGPKSIVDTIVRAEALIDLSMLPAREGSTSNAVPFVLVDRDGKTVESPLITVSSNDGAVIDSMIVNYSLVSKRVITVSDLSLVSGVPADGYQVLSVTTTPREIVAVGLQSDLEALDNLFVNQTVDVTGLSTSVAETLRLRKPTEINLLKPDSVTVMVEIGPKMISRTFNDLPITVIKVSEGLDARYGSIRGRVTVTGPYHWINELSRDQLELVCNAANLEAGSYPMPVQFQLSDGESVEYYYDVSPEVMMVELVPVKDK